MTAMRHKRHTGILLNAAAALSLSVFACGCGGGTGDLPANPKDDGYRGIWHADMESDDEYRYIYYSGGLGTSTAKHLPMAYYAESVNKTFFCWGGSARDTNRLRLMISCYDHASGTVPRPTVIMEKETEDHHDNPTIMLDSEGYIWVFLSAHGRVRFAYIYRSAEPYSIERFDLVEQTNFSYPQPWYIDGRGFLFLHTLYIDGRNLYFSTSPDGYTWSEPALLAAIDEGHYQVSWREGNKVGTAFNYHPSSTAGGNWDDPENPGVDPAASGTNNRTNLYYIETGDFGATWTTAAGETVDIPVTSSRNPALVHDYRSEGLLVYMKDMAFDRNGWPVILFLTSKGSESGPRNDPRTWNTAHWDGTSWDISPVTTSDNNYDVGCIYIETDGLWRIIAPTETGPHPYNCGGEMAVWESRDEGSTWTMSARVTEGSEYNHSYARKPVNAHPEFYAFWADGHGRGLSESRLYFCDRTGNGVFRLPSLMTVDAAKPEPLDKSSLQQR